MANIKISGLLALTLLFSASAQALVAQNQELSPEQRYCLTAYNLRWDSAETFGKDSAAYEALEEQTYECEQLLSSEELAGVANAHARWLQRFRFVQ